MTDVLHPVLEQVLPVAVFLLAITVTAEIAQLAGVFDVAAHAMARRARHRVVLLWLLFAALAVVSTIVMSLDTTAVLLTPVGLAIARQTGIAPMPFALTTLWIANTGSLLLPVSNLTNLLAVHRFEDLGAGHGDYVRTAALPALTAIVATAPPDRRPAAARAARDLRRRPARRAARPGAARRRRRRVAGDRTPLRRRARAGGGVASRPRPCSWPRLLWRAPSLLREVRPPWLMAGAFVVVAGLLRLAQGEGLLDWLAPAVGTGTRPLDLLHLSGASAVAANLVNNLPAYLARGAVRGGRRTPPRRDARRRQRRRAGHAVGLARHAPVAAALPRRPGCRSRCSSSPAGARSARSSASPRRP